MNRRNFLCASAALSSVAGIAPGLLRAQGKWPTNTVNIRVSSAPGGVPDALARLVAHELETKYQKPFVVLNKPGANGLIGMAEALRAPADGNTLIWGVAAWVTINPLIFDKITYDVADLVPLIQIGTSPYTLYVNAKLGVNSVADLVKLAKSEPGKLTYGSSGNGSSAQLNTELLKQTTGIDLMHVPYNSAAEALRALAAGDIDVFMIDFALGTPLVATGKIKMLAVVGSKRVAQIPDVPCFAELGYPITAVGWNGLFYKKGTPNRIIDTVTQNLQNWVQSAAGKEQLTNASLVPTGVVGKDFQAILERDKKTWEKVIKASNLKIRRS